jgi:hypothetical protein
MFIRVEYTCVYLYGVSVHQLVIKLLSVLNNDNITINFFS